jgi:anthranilate synthase component I
MQAMPSPETFARRYKAGKAQVVWTRLVADLETPVSVYLKLAASLAPSILLESVEGGASRGRYSVIGFDPDVIWRANGNTAEINRSAAKKPDAFKKEKKPTLSSLRDFLDESGLELPPELPPMAAGVFGYMGYDTVRLIEHLPGTNPDDLGVPDSIMMRPRMVVIFDSVKDEISIVTPVRPDAKQTAAGAYKKALSRLKTAVRALEAPLPQLGALVPKKLAQPEPRSNTRARDYLGMVERAKEYIRAGDIFQVVLSQRFSAPFALPSIALYRALRRLNPSPFLFHLDFGGFSLVGSSPEILVRVRNGEVTIRPIAGTARRGEDEAEDTALADALLRDPKERAEHLMLLDLGRNDVGRVADVGTVEVTHKFVVERYSHVMHIVSNVIGKLRKSHDAVDALMAGFPAGTVSGAPKVRAMEIIDELEKSKRGPYAGCVGYFTADGEMDTCIVLRTGLVKDGKLYVQSGAGVVFDSVPENEQQECINKAKAIVRAAEEAVRFASGRRKGAAKKSGNGGPFA